MEILQKIDEPGGKWSEWPIEGDDDVMMRPTLYHCSNVQSLFRSFLPGSIRLLDLEVVEYFAARVRLAVRGSRGPRSIDTGIVTRIRRAPRKIFMKFQRNTRQVSFRPSPVICFPNKTRWSRFLASRTHHYFVSFSY